MKFKKISNPKKPNVNKIFTINDLKMVKVTYTFPVWKTAGPDDIMAELSDSDLDQFDATIEEAVPSYKDLEDFMKSRPENADWYFYHRDIDVTLSDILMDSKKPSKKSAKN
jgi:hypothetical protein